MLYNLISLSKKMNVKIRNRTVSNPEENSLFLDLKPYAFLLKAVASALSVPLVTNLRRKKGVDSGAVQQGEPFPCLLYLPLDDGGSSEPFFQFPSHHPIS